MAVNTDLSSIFLAVMNSTIRCFYYRDRIQESAPSLADFSRYVDKLAIDLTPFPMRKGGKFKVSLLKG